MLDVIHGERGDKLYLVFEYFNIDMKKYLDIKGSPLSISHVKDTMW